MTVRLREPFFSIYNSLESDEKITLNDFVSRMKQIDIGYEKFDEKELRKIAYRQICRLREEELLIQLSPKWDQNPEFVKIWNQNTSIAPMSGCRISPFTPKNGSEDEFSEVLEHVQAQIDSVQTKKTELAGEAEAYRKLSECFPKIQTVIAERTRTLNFETAKLNGMLNALTLTIDTLRSESNRM
ncbi:hypothetical protein ACLHFD_001989 [Vibrio alginolyticus]